MKFNHKKFFTGFKEHFDASLDQKQVDGIEFLLTSFETNELWKDVRHIAYALATTYHETAGSMQPVEEGYYLGSATRVKAFQKTLRYYPYFGRGYVQLTWETKRIPNYSKASKALGIDFVKNPNLVMEEKNAFAIMTLGMFEGWFTSKKLKDYINSAKTDYVNARRIINGTDKAGLIAGYARLFEKILKDSAAASSPPQDDLTPLDQGESTASASAADNSSEKGADAPIEGSTAPTPPAVEMKAAAPSLTSRIGAGISYLAGLGISVGTFFQGKLESITINQVIIIAALLGAGYAIYHFSSKRAQERTKMYFENAKDTTTAEVKVV